jgi:hypothetical protein
MFEISLYGGAVGKYMLNILAVMMEKMLNMKSTK